MTRSGRRVDSLFALAIMATFLAYHRSPEAASASNPAGKPASASNPSGPTGATGAAENAPESKGGAGRQPEKKKGKGSKGETGKVVLIKTGSAMRFLANAAPPASGRDWAGEKLDDSKWTPGVYAIGDAGAADEKVLRTKAPQGISSVFTRAAFTIGDPKGVRNVFLAGRHGHGWAAWINGTEIYRSPDLPKGPLDWDARASRRDPAAGGGQRTESLVDVSGTALPALHAGANLFAAGVWRGATTTEPLLLAPNLSINRSAGITRGPYLQMATPASMILRWRTEIPTKSLVRFGAEPNRLTERSDEEGGAVTEHSVLVRGLKPETTYYYAVGTATDSRLRGDTDHAFRTSPPAGSSSPIRILVLGDSGTADQGEKAVRDGYEKFAGETRTDLWLMLGDNAYPDGTDRQYQAALFKVYPKLLALAPLWPVSGNHDEHAKGSEGGDAYASIFDLPEKGEAGGVASETESYYSFDCSNVHFIALNSCESDRTATGPMLSWLKRDIGATTQEWTVAYWHHAPYSKGSQDSDEDPAMIDMRANALPILEDGGVDLVLGGHSHVYERSFLLDGHYGSSESFKPSMKRGGGDGRPDGDGAYPKPTRGRAPHEGTVYVVAGSSGHTGSGTLRHPAMCVSLKALGSFVIDVKGDRLDASFVDTSGAARDHFAIVKGGGKP